MSDIKFGMELPLFIPDTSLSAAKEFAKIVGYSGGGRFENHSQARAQGLPGALLPGIMSMGYLTRVIHEWAPSGTIQHIDTIFRAPILADHKHIISAVVTDIDEENSVIVLDLSIKNLKAEPRVFGTATISIPKF